MAEVQLHPETHAALENAIAFSEKHGLTKAEKNVVLYVVQGLSNKEIGEKLFVTTSTVKFHLYHVYKKTGLNSRAKLTAAIVYPSYPS